MNNPDLWATGELQRLDNARARMLALTKAREEIASARFKYQTLFVLLLVVPWAASIVWRWSNVAAGEPVLLVCAYAVGQWCTGLAADRIVGGKVLRELDAKFPEPK